MVYHTGIMNLFGAFMLFFAVLALAAYIYTAIVLMALAKKTKTPNGWLGWIPIGNIYLMTQLAKLPGWWTFAVIIAIIPMVGALAFGAIGVWWWWLIAERLKKPGYWGLLMVLPGVNLIVMGVLAWGK